MKEPQQLKENDNTKKNNNNNNHKNIYRSFPPHTIYHMTKYRNTK